MQITSFRQKSWFSSETRNLLAKSQTPNEGSSQRIGNSTQINYFEWSKNNVIKIYILTHCVTSIRHDELLWK